MTIHNLFKSLFWLWHIIYVVITISLIIPYLFVPMAISVFEGHIPAYYLLYSIIMASLPFASIVLAITLFKGNTRNLIRYFYGFEMTLLFFLCIKMVSLRALNFSLIVVMLNVIIAMSVWLYFIWEEQKQNTFPKALIENNFALLGSIIIVLVGLYIGTLLSLYIFPFAVEFVSMIIHKIININWGDIKWFLLHPLRIFGSFFALLTILLFMGLPVGIIYLYTAQFKKFLPTLLSFKKIALVIGILTLNIGLFVTGNHQPQVETFALLDKTFADPKAEAHLLQQKTTIKQGLLNAYLSPYRYITSSQDNDNIASEYERILGFSKKSAKIPETIFEFLAAPLFYQGSRHDVEKAKNYYARFFDAPIQKAERVQIVNTIEHAWDLANGNEASLLSANSHFVHVTKQEIELKEKQGVANILITESFENLTHNLKEIVIHFSLPNDAIVKGLWLSSDANKPKMFPFVLSPKGAAQAVYKAEVNRRVDPALLEKVGPNQYRLRVYPVPAKPYSDIDKVEHFQMQLAYETLPNAKGEWPLPIVLEKRNIFWDDETERVVNGQKITLKKETWMPAILATTQMVAPKNISLQQGDQFIHAILRQHKKEKVSINKPLAVLVDGSYSMIQYKAALQKTLNDLKSKVAAVEVYFCRQTCRPFDNINTAPFFGQSQTGDHISAFIALKKSTDYRAVLILSDEGSYEIRAKSETKKLTINSPVWLVHLNGMFAYAYDDKVLDLLYRSKGGISKTIDEALLAINPTEILRAVHLSPDTTVLSITKDRIWVKSDQPANHTNSALQKIAAAQTIKHLMRSMDMQALDNLDAIHAFAKQNTIVTHYSSMLVLVDDRQKEALKKAEVQTDRFEREVEQGDTQADMFSIPSVPEPEEWVLMIIASILLIFAYQRQRKIRRAVNRDGRKI